MLLVDAHVHVYPCFDLSSFFSSAYKNFRSATASLREEKELTPVIALADWSRQSWFNKFKECAETINGKKQLPVQGWSFHATGDHQSVKVVSIAGERILIIAAKKIISAENLEVLALGTASDFEDGLPLQASLEAISRHPDAPIPVVPWAVGKWWGRRGKILESVMRNAGEPFFYLCDNGNRPTFWPRPYHFRLADELGIRILAGSDPLHFKSDGVRAGRYGFYLPAGFATDSPALAFKKALSASAPTPLKFFGDLESGRRFLQNQIRMQIFKKKWKKELLK